MSDATSSNDPRTLGERLITAARLAAAEHVRQELMGLDRRKVPDRRQSSDGQGTIEKRSTPERRKVAMVAHLVTPPSHNPPQVVGRPVRVTATVRRRPPSDLKEAA